MTTTTEPTTTRQVPEWLDLDAMISPNARKMFATELTEIIAELPVLVRLAQRYQSALTEWDDETEGKGLYAVDGLDSILKGLVGIDVLEDFGVLVSEMFTPCAESVPSEQWLKAAVARFGVEIPRRSPE